jgi:hypothetical protein
MPRVLAIAVFQLLISAPAHACLFAKDAQPAQWYGWSTSLFAADVASVEDDPQKALDVITVRVVETFKGPQGAAATLQVPSRMWSSCRLERPLVGARVLVALNPSGDTLLVPLSANYTELLRQHRSKAEPPPPQRGDKPFSY